MRSRLTMQQISEELGLSRLTVSSVINGRAHQIKISNPTIERVQQYLKKRGFVPSRQAITLRDRQRRAVGIFHCGTLYSHLTDAFNLMVNRFSHGLQGLEIMIVCPEQLVEGIRELIARGVTSLIWIQTRHPQLEFREEKLLLPLLANVTAIIYNYHFEASNLDSYLESHGIHLIGVSRKKGCEKLAACLKAFGHRRVILADIPFEHKDDFYREDVETFEAAGLTPIIPLSVEVSSADPRAYGAALVAEIIAAMKTESVTAVCLRDDEIAAFVMHGLISKGVRIPEQLTVTGFDGMRLAETLRVPLTTLRIPADAMVECAAGLLHTRSQVFSHRFEIELIKRASLGKAADAVPVALAPNIADA